MAQPAYVSRELAGDGLCFGECVGLVPLHGEPDSDLGVLRVGRPVDQAGGDQLYLEGIVGDHRHALTDVQYAALEGGELIHVMRLGDSAPGRADDHGALRGPDRVRSRAHESDPDTAAAAAAAAAMMI